MAAGPVFPGFIRIEYKTDPSAKAKFLAEAAQLGGEVKKPFSEAFDQIGKMVDRVSGKLKDGNFSIDLDVAGLRQAAAQTDFTMKKVQALRDAAVSLATKNRDNSESTQAFVKALQAQAAQSEAAASAARDQVTAYTNLQSAVSGLTRENEALAQSYRDTFLEQAKVANAAYKAQQQFNALSAPGIGRAAKSARDSASVFESQSYPSKFAKPQSTRFGTDALIAGDASLDKAAASGTRLEDVLRRVSVKGREVTAALREAAIAAEKAAAEQGKALNAPKPANSLPQSTRFGAEALVAGQASLDRAAISGATLEQVLGRVANKGREVSAALAEAERAAASAARERAAAEAQALANAEKTKALAAAEMQRLAQAAGQLRAELDPTVAVQNRFNAALDQADELLKAGVIDQRLYAQAVSKAQNDLQESWSSLARVQEEQQKVQKRGTNETQNVINSTRALRVAGIQAGQQIQDMAIQFQMGTKATTVFAQQLPQLAFALSGLEGNTNKTLDKVGKFSTFLAGPWGAAILVATVALAPFIEELFATENALDSVGKAAQDAMQKLQQSVANASNFTDALSTSQKSLVLAMGKVGRAQRDILETQKAINGLQGVAGSSPTVTALSNRLTQLKAEKAAADKDLNTAKADLANIRGLGDTVRIQDANKKILNPDKPKKVREDKSAERAAKAAIRLGEFGEDAAKKIANIADSFRDIPPEVERVNRASRELDDIISDLMNRKPKGFEDLVKQAEALKTALPDAAIQQAMKQITKDAQQQVQYQMLILQGREGEAQALQVIAQKEQQFGELSKARKDEIIATGIALQRINEQIERAGELQAAFLNATRSVREEVEGVLGGYGSIASLGSVLKRQMQNVRGKVLTEAIFGDMFRDLDRWVKKETGIKDSVDILKSETERAGSAAGSFADAMTAATSRIMGGSASGGMVAGASAVTAWGNIKIPDSIRNPAFDGDPNGPIVVEAKKQTTGKTVNELTPQEYFMRMGNSMSLKLVAALEGALGGRSFLSKFTGTIGGAIGGYATLGTKFGAGLGAARGLMFDYGKDLFGEKLGDKILGGLDKAFGGAQTGSTVSGISNALGIKMSNTGAQIGGAIGSFIPIPGGQIIGSIAGGLLGNLFGKKVTSGYAQVRGGKVAGTYGRTKDLQNDAAEAAGGLVETIASLAKTLGTKLGYYEFDYGKKDNKFVVNTGGGGLGTFNFDNEQEAMAFAVRNAVSDGAFVGIKDAQKRLLMANGDLQAQVEKAVKFGDVFKQLKALKDPVGAALDELNSQFSDLIDIFREAGASASDLASLEELYGIKRKDAIKQASEAAIGPLKSLLQNITVGSDFYSLRDRQASAQAVYNPLAARVSNGDMTAYAEFSDAAQSLIDINRQLYGSTSPFYDFLDSVKAITNGALTSEQAKSDAANVSDSPFNNLAVQQQATVSAIDSQTEALLAALGAVNDNLVAALRSNQVNQSASSDVTSLLRAGGAW